jgi:hypothetical protein
MHDHHIARRRVLRCLAGALLVPVAPGMAPATSQPPRFAAPIARALLIGVHTYQPPLQSLAGVPNDVALLHRAMLAQGVPPAAIRILADVLPEDAGLQSAAPPTRAAILAAFDALVDVARPGEKVFISMSGHGSQQPAPVSASEPDGMDETFLPADIGRFTDARTAVANAIIDDEIGAMLDRLAAKRVFAWLVFDSCHSGTLTRTVEARGRRRRGVAPELLGLPAPPSPRPGEALPPADAGTRAYVAFAATQSGESAYEVEQVEADGRRVPYGPMSLAVGRMLLEGAPTSYRQAAARVLVAYDRYRTGDPRTPPPLFEGDLDRPLAPNGARLLEWPGEATLLGDGFRVEAGQLHGLTDGSEVLLTDPDALEKGPLARGRVVGVGLTQAVVRVVSTPTQPLPRRVLARLIGAPAVPPLRVAWRDMPAGIALAATVGGVLRNDQGIRFVAADAPHDTAVQFAAGRIWVAGADTALSDYGAVGVRGFDPALPAGELGPDIARVLERRAQAHRLIAMSEQFTDTPAARALRVAVTMAGAGRDAGGQSRACGAPPEGGTPVPPGSVPVLRHCDTLRLAIDHVLPDSVDLAIFYISTAGELFPLRGHSRGFRIAPGGAPVPVELVASTWNMRRQAAEPSGTEQVVLVGVVRAGRATPSETPDFAALVAGRPASPQLASSADEAAAFAGLSPHLAATTRSLGIGNARAAALAWSLRWRTVRDAA